MAARAVRRCPSARKSRALGEPDLQFRARRVAGHGCCTRAGMALSFHNSAPLSRVRRRLGWLTAASLALCACPPEPAQAPSPPAQAAALTHFEGEVQLP